MLSCQIIWYADVDVIKYTEIASNNLICLQLPYPTGLDTARKNQEIDDDDKEDDVITKVR